MRHDRKIKEPIVAITKGMTEGQSLEKALDMRSEEHTSELQSR